MTPFIDHVITQAVSLHNPTFPYFELPKSSLPNNKRVFGKNYTIPNPMVPVYLLLFLSEPSITHLDTIPFPTI